MKKISTLYTVFVHSETEGIYSLGIFDNYEQAIGRIFTDINDQVSENETFTSKILPMQNDTGSKVTVQIRTSTGFVNEEYICLFTYEEDLAFLKNLE